MHDQDTLIEHSPKYSNKRVTMEESYNQIWTVKSPSRQFSYHPAYGSAKTYVAECLHPLQVSYPSGLNEHLWINISLDNNENLLYLLVTSTVVHHRISLLVLMICATLSM